MGTSARKLEVYCSLEERGGVEEVLSREGLYWYGETVRLRGEEEVCRITAYAPLHALDRVYRGLSGRLDMRRRENLVVVIDAEAYSGAPARAARRRFTGLTIRPRLKPRLLLGSEVEELSSSSMPGHVIMAVLAALVALTGLVRDNPYLVLGAMLLSPVLAPIYAFSASIVLGLRRAAARSLYSLLLLLFFASAASLAVSGLACVLFGPESPTGEILSRASIGWETALVPVLLGAAAMLGPSIGMGEALVGVAIAAAIIPPAAALGWSLACAPSLAWGVAGNLGLNIAGLLAGATVSAALLQAE